MDTVNMLNTMRFYCQPILPLVYDESMSYYETLCKVVGQLNTTGDAVNKLNEGLTNEIADRQAADAALDERLKGEISDRQKADSLLNERLKVVEAATNKTHFLAFAGTPPYGAKPIGTMPTRDELRHWVNDGDMIVTLMETQEEGRNVVYAASCSYNAGNWTNESSDDFNIIVPISTAYDSEGDYAVRQKIAKITIPPASASSLDEKWGLQIIEVNTPSTSAEGVVNLTASLYGSNEVNCSITPSEFLGLYNMTRGGKNLCVAVNARLEYDAHIRSSSIATVNPYVGTIVITFEEDDGVYTDYGVNQAIRVIHYLIGNAETNTWEHESIRSRIQDFVRYEGFQFTRKSGNVIATENDSTPSAVYSYYTQLNGKLYQNLPTRLIDEVDGAEYWNGIFDSYSDGHITYTFTTANYATIGDKMTVRVIELSATKADSMWSGAEKWSYAAKEFDIPYRQTFYALDVWGTSDTPAVINGIVTYAGGSNLDFDDLLPLVENNQRFVATLHKGISETAPEWSSLVYSSQSVKNGVGNITFAITTGINLENGIPVMDGTVVFSKDASGAKKVQIVFASALPAPSADGSDDGKVPTVVGDKWELSNADKRVVVSCNVGDLVGYVDGYLAFSITCDHAAQEVVALLQDGVNVVATASLGDSNGIFIASSWEAGDVPSVVFTGAPGALSENSVSPVTNIMLSSEKSYYRISAALPPLQPNVHNGRALVASDSGSTEYSTVRLEDKAVRFDADNSAIEVTNGNFRFVAPDGARATAENLRVDGTIVYDENQNLTEAQKRQARVNIDTLSSIAPNIKQYMIITPATEPDGIGVSLWATSFGTGFKLDISDANEDQPTLLTGVKTPTDADTNAAATVEYVKAKVAGASGGAPIAIKLGTGNAATSTATFAEIKAALEAGNAPILDSASGTAHWFALNWVLNGSNSLSIQYGTFEVTGGGAADFSIYDVGVSSSGITYAMRQFSTE